MNPKKAIFSSSHKHHLNSEGLITKSIQLIRHDKKGIIRFLLFIILKLQKELRPDYTK